MKDCKSLVPPVGRACQPSHTSHTPPSPSAPPLRRPDESLEALRSEMALVNKSLAKEIESEKKEKAQAERLPRVGSIFAKDIL